MNKEEFIDKVFMSYCGDRNASRDIIAEYDRLNNILNELEEYLIEHIDEYREMEQDAMFEFGLVLDKLKALKENK